MGDLLIHAAIDPGAKRQGVCLYRGRDGVILWVGCVEGPTPRHHMAAIVRSFGRPATAPRVTVERMVHHPGRRASVPNDLIRVSESGSGLAHLLAGPGGDVVFAPAARWKGTVPKNVHHKRIRKVLDPRESAMLEKALKATPKRGHSEAMDSIGLALWASGRTGRAGRGREHGKDHESGAGGDG